MMRADKGRSLLVNAVAARLLDHHLRLHGQDVSMLTDAVRGVLADMTRRSAAATLPIGITNDRGAQARATTVRMTQFALEDGGALQMPPTLATLFLDDDGDVIMTFRELMISPEVFLNELPKKVNLVRLVTTTRLPETLGVAVTDRPLRDLVSHPALDPMTLGIQRVEVLPKGNTFNLAGSPPMGTAITLSTTGRIVLPLDQGSTA